MPNRRKGVKTMNNEAIENAKRVFGSVTKYIEFKEEWDNTRNSIRNYSPNTPKIIFNDREESDK